MRRVEETATRRIAGAATLLCASLLWAGNATAGLLTGPPEDGYKEQATSTLPTYSVDHTIGIDMPYGSTVTLGVDPKTISVGADNIVRYVVVARSVSGGAVSARYEGIRCETAEVKVYARHYADGDWHPVADPAWQSLYAAGGAQYSLPIAKAGICHDASTNGTPQQMVQDLKGSAFYKAP